MKISKTAAAIIAIIIGTAAITAQNGTVTPYSRFGYGILRDNATAAQQAMGGVGYAMNSGRQINVMNPASYARIDSLTFLFDMGVDLTNLWSTETTASGDRLSEHQVGGGLNYLTLQFPLGKRMGMSIGVLPWSSVGYAFGNSIDNGYASRQGSGSINELYVGVAGRITGGLTAGINIAYMFGSTVNDTYAITDQSSTSLYENELTVHDWHLDAGLQYTHSFGRNRLTAGLVWSPGKKLLGKIRTYAYDIDNNLTESEEHSSVRTNDTYSIAATWGAGINYEWNDRLMVEGNFTFQPWSKAKYDGTKGQFADRYKIALGAQYRQANRGSYGKRIQYRLGGYFNRDYLMVRGNNVREYGASIGLGLPVPGFKTVVNLGIGWVHRQAHPSPLIKENYLNITLGINFNEMWFRKSRIY